eukprot:scaffold94544_cov39-Tisochrysis_lutea.AAC.2
MRPLPLNACVCSVETPLRKRPQGVLTSGPRSAAEHSTVQQLLAGVLAAAVAEVKLMWLVWMEYKCWSGWMGA